MSLLFAVFIVNFMIFTCYAAPTGQCKANRDNTVSYSGFQVWTITPHSKTKQVTLLKIMKQYSKFNLKILHNIRNVTLVLLTELEMWKETNEIHQPVNIMVPPRYQKEIKLKLEEAKIPYDIEIGDLQKAINDENPTTNSSLANPKSGKT